MTYDSKRDKEFDDALNEMWKKKWIVYRMLYHSKRYLFVGIENDGSECITDDPTSAKKMEWEEALAVRNEYNERRKNHLFLWLIGEVKNEK